MPLTNTPATLPSYDLEQRIFLDDVLQGLSRSQKTLPCKYFYDQRGSQIFDQICELAEYYPTRTETVIMQAHIAEIAACCGDEALLIEYGSGSSTKTRVLLDHLPTLAGYVPIDISREHLLSTADALRHAYPRLDIWPVCADYTQSFRLPQSDKPSARKVVYFPGSTIGNFHRRQAADFLSHIRTVCGFGGGLLIGVDLKKSPQILEPAYNDRAGVTAAFNLNLLTRINRELGADFVLGQFEHMAFYNAFLGRIEMHLVSLANQTVQIGESMVAFDQDETIHTECSYKYSLDEFSAMAAGSGFAVEQVWTDPQQLFSVQSLRGV